MSKAVAIVVSKNVCPRNGHFDFVARVGLLKLIIRFDDMFIGVVKLNQIIFRECSVDRYSQLGIGAIIVLGQVIFLVIIASIYIRQGHLRIYRPRPLRIRVGHDRANALKVDIECVTLTAQWVIATPHFIRYIDRFDACRAFAVNIQDNTGRNSLLDRERTHCPLSEIMCAPMEGNQIRRFEMLEGINLHFYTFKHGVLIHHTVVHV